MVTVEVELKEGDEEPEQHLDDGEHIERVVVPISDLYEKLQGKFCHLYSSYNLLCLCRRWMVTVSV